MSGISERNPFVGPRPIQQGEPLYGRDLEIRELYHRLQARRIVVLHSPSGAGKSSLVQAGLIPRLLEGGYDVWKPIRVNLDPAELDGVPEGTNRYLLSAMISLEDELPEKNRRAPAALAGLDFREYVETRPRRKGRGQRPVVLVFDQFEEVLTTTALAVDAKRSFFTAIGRALEVETYWALFLIREDHLGALAPYRDRIPTQLSNTFRLDLLGLAGAREAAVNLAEQGGRSFPGVDQLVRDLSLVQVQQPDGSFVAEQGLHVEPVQLQVVCRRLWDAMPADDLSIDPEDIDAYASVTSALAGYYADIVRTTASGDEAVERALREWVGSKLIVGGIRSPVRREAGKTAGLDNRLIASLLDSYLVRSEPRAGAYWYELSHDRLVEPVLRDNEAWAQTHLHPLQVQARLWEDARRSASLLLAAEALPDAQAWAKAHPGLVTEGEREFLGLSVELRAKERAARRRLVVLAVAAAGVAVIVGVLGVVAWVARDQAVAAEADARAAEADARAAEADADRQRNEARVQARRARTASLMAGGREFLARGQAAAGVGLLLEVKEPEGVRGWSELALELLSVPIPKTALRGHVDAVNAVAWSPDGQHIVTVSRDKTARVWRADGTGEPVVLRGHEGPVTGAAWSPDGLHIVTAHDKTARVWRVDGTGEPVVLRGHKGEVAGAAWSPDGLHIVTVSWDYTARVWRADGTGEPVVLRGHEGPMIGAAWSPDGRHIVTGSADNTARVWRADGTSESVLLRRHEGPVSGAAWSPDGLHIVNASADNTARVWRADGTGEPVVLRGHEERVRTAAWSPDGLHIVTASFDKTARVWRADGTGEPVVLRGHEDSVTGAAWSPDGLHIVTASFDKTARVWRADGTGEPVVLRGHESPVMGAAWSPDGLHIVTASKDKTARVWRADGTGVLRGHERGITAAAWSPDGLHIVTASFDKAARAWRADGKGEPVVLRGHEELVYGAAWSPDGLHIVTASHDETARVWRADGTGEPVVLRGHEGPVMGAAWSPDGLHIVTASFDKTARVWKADGTGEPVVLRGHKSLVRATAWSPDGLHIVTASWDETARVWRADGTGEPVVLRGHERRITAAAWSPDGLHIVTASEDKTARVWRADGTGEPVVLRGHESRVTGAAWSPDGLHIVTASDDNTARVWVYPLEQALRAATTDCLSPETRLLYLDETEAQSRAGYEACERFHGRTPPYSGPPVTLYMDPNLTGHNVDLTEPGSYPTTKSGDFDDDALSSIKVPKGLRVTLYEDPNFKGRAVVLTADTPDLGDFDDLCSSLRIESR